MKNAAQKICSNVFQLAKWLFLFAAEVRQVSGDFYLLAMISQLLAGLLRSVNASTPNFMDKKDPCSAPFHNT